MRDIEFKENPLGLDLFGRGMTHTRLVGRPQVVGHEPTPYVTTDEAAIVEAARLLVEQGFRIDVGATRVIEPNFYSILYVRPMDDGSHELESIELRLVREGAEFIPLALVGVTTDGPRRIGDKVVRDTTLPKARQMISLTSDQRSYRYTVWMPLFGGELLI